MRPKANRIWLSVLAIFALAGAAHLPALSEGVAVPPHGYAEARARYNEARQAYEAQAEAYWQAIADKRRQRNAKRRNGEAVGLDDYVLTQPPVYSGPPRPVDPSAPPAPPVERPPIPEIADFLKAAADVFGFVPQRPASETEAKRLYAKAALAAGLTPEQIVRVYAFETGGYGTYDMQAGIVPGKGGRAISPAIGYNQLLSTNSIGLIAENGDRYLAVLRQKLATLSGAQKREMADKIEAFKRILAFTRSVPNRWSEHDRLAKTTVPGMGVHAVVLDRDLGPLLQAQKLANSVAFARRKGRTAPLTAVELELMNFTGDGNGFDMVTMPQPLRERVPTANFFQRAGYERNPIARRTGTVAALIASIDAKMDSGAKARGSQELAAILRMR